MINYLPIEEIKEINKKALEIEGEGDKHYLEYTNDLQLCLKKIREKYENDLYFKALAYCISIIVIHPFKNGNHRASLFSSERFLMKNNYITYATDEKRLALMKWRIEYEEKHDLERIFFSIFINEDYDLRWKKIKGVMDSEYGQKILIWLKENYKQS